MISYVISNGAKGPFVSSIVNSRGTVTLSEQGMVAALVHTAGTGTPGTVVELTPGDWTGSVVSDDGTSFELLFVHDTTNDEITVKGQVDPVSESLLLWISDIVQVADTTTKSIMLAYLTLKWQRNASTGINHSTWLVPRLDGEVFPDFGEYLYVQDQLGAIPGGRFKVQTPGPVTGEIVNSVAGFMDFWAVADPTLDVGFLVRLRNPRGRSATLEFAAPTARDIVSWIGMPTPASYTPPGVGGVIASSFLGLGHIVELTPHVPDVYVMLDYLRDRHVLEGYLSTFGPEVKDHWYNRDVRVRYDVSSMVRYGAVGAGYAEVEAEADNLCAALGISPKNMLVYSMSFWNDGHGSRFPNPTPTDTDLVPRGMVAAMASMTQKGYRLGIATSPPHASQFSPNKANFWDDTAKLTRNEDGSRKLLSNAVHRVVYGSGSGTAILTNAENVTIGGNLYVSFGIEAGSTPTAGTIYVQAVGAYSPAASNAITTPSGFAATVVSSAVDDFGMVSFRTPEIREFVRGFWRDAYESTFPGARFDLTYNDVICNPISDYNSGIPATEQGMYGQAAGLTNRASYIRDYRHLDEAVWPPLVNASPESHAYAVEFPIVGSWLAGDVHGISGLTSDQTYSQTLVGAQHPVSLAAYLYGHLAMLYNPVANIIGFTPGALGTYATDFNALTLARDVLNGCVPFLAAFNGRNRHVLTPSDGTYGTEYVGNYANFVTLLRRIVTSMPLLRKYQMGRRLHPIPNSPVHTPTIKLISVDGATVPGTIAVDDVVTFSNGATAVVDLVVAAAPGVVIANLRQFTGNRPTVLSGHTFSTSSGASGPVDGVVATQTSVFASNPAAELAIQDGVFESSDGEGMAIVLINWSGASDTIDLMLSGSRYPLVQGRFKSRIWRGSLGGYDGAQDSVDSLRLDKTITVPARDIAIVEILPVKPAGFLRTNSGATTSERLQVQRQRRTPARETRAINLSYAFLGMARPAIAGTQQFDSLYDTAVADSSEAELRQFLPGPEALVNNTGFAAQALGLASTINLMNLEDSTLYPNTTAMMSSVFGWPASLLPAIASGDQTGAMAAELQSLDPLAKNAFMRDLHLVASQHPWRAYFPVNGFPVFSVSTSMGAVYLRRVSNPGTIATTMSVEVVLTVPTYINGGGVTAGEVIVTFPTTTAIQSITTTPTYSVETGTGTSILRLAFSPSDGNAFAPGSTVVLATVVLSAVTPTIPGGTGQAVVQVVSLFDAASAAVPVQTVHGQIRTELH